LEKDQYVRTDIVSQYCPVGLLDIYWLKSRLQEMFSGGHMGHPRTECNGRIGGISFNLKPAQAATRQVSPASCNIKRWLRERVGNPAPTA
jgi:hypothetical protein